MKLVLLRAIEIRDRRDGAAFGPNALTRASPQVKADIDRLLRCVPPSEDLQRIARHLRRERDALFTFLYIDGTPATNYLAKQALRPAVVNRKMSPHRKCRGVGSYIRQVLSTGAVVQAEVVSVVTGRQVSVGVRTAAGVGHHIAFVGPCPSRTGIWVNIRTPRGRVWPVVIEDLYRAV